MAAVKILVVTVDLRGCNIRLCFDGVDPEERLYLNGELLGTRAKLVAQLRGGNECPPNTIATLPDIDLS